MFCSIIFTSFFPFIFCNNKERFENSIYILNLNRRGGKQWGLFHLAVYMHSLSFSFSIKPDACFSECELQCSSAQLSVKLMMRLLFCSPKFSRKLFYITRLQDLADIVHLDQIDIPKQVMEQVSLLCHYMLQVKIKFRLNFFNPG